MPTVLEAVTHGQRLIRQQEPVMAGRLVEAYRVVMQRVEGQIQAYEWQIQQAIDAGEPVNEAWLRQQTWYRQLQGSIDAEFARFSGTAAQTVGTAQMDALRAVSESERIFRAAIDMPFTGRVNAPAFERWVSAMQPRSPIREVIERYGPRTSRIILQSLTEGLGTGQGVNSIVRDIRRKAGPDTVEWRLRSVIRTEGMRAFRGGLSETLSTYEDEGIIQGYRWTSARSARTCLACIVRDGTVTKQYPTGWHVNCRCVASPVVRPDLVPGGRTRESGPEWLARQDAKTQRRIFASDERYRAYQDGTPITDMVGVRRNRTWGPSVYVKPTSAISGGR